MLTCHRSLCVEHSACYLLQAPNRSILHSEIFSVSADLSHPSFENSGYLLDCLSDTVLEPSVRWSSVKLIFWEILDSSCSRESPWGKKLQRHTAAEMGMNNTKRDTIPPWLVVTVRLDPGLFVPLPSQRALLEGTNNTYQHCVASDAILSPKVYVFLLPGASLAPDYASSMSCYLAFIPVLLVL